MIQENLPLSVPHFVGNELAYLKECINTNWVSTAGPHVEEFEARLANLVARRFGVSTSSGTAALHLALLVAGVKVGDEVIIPSLTFIAPANAVRYIGAWPVFLDIESRYWQLDPDELENFLRKDCVRDSSGCVRNSHTGRTVRCILPVHLLGHPCDMDRILSLAREYNLPVVEDATESLGAFYNGAPVGAHGDIACFSFNGNKIITTGGGGMLVTDTPRFADRARYLSTQAKDDPVEYIHNEVGYNYRLTNLQAALGLAQLEQLTTFVAARRRICAAYREGLETLPGLSFQGEAAWATPTFWLSTLLVDENDFGLDRRSMLTALQAQGIQTRPLWQPLHLSRAHAESWAVGGKVAEQIHERALSLPSSSFLSPDQLERVSHCVRSLRK